MERELERNKINFLQKWITPKVVAWTIFLGYVFTLLPLFFIGLYNYPSADDYSIGSNARQAWVNSHSLFYTLWEAAIRALEDWKIWMGYFTSNFLMAVPPSIFGERWYALTTIIVIGSITLSTVYLLIQIFEKVLKAEKYISRSVIFILLFFTIQCMVGRVEALYWYCSAANYMLTHSMALFFYGMLISLVFKKYSKIFLFFISIWAFLVGGANQPTALNVAIILSVALFYLLVTGKWRENKRIFFPICLFYLGFLCNIAAPGNWVRSESSHGMNPIKAIMVSLLYTLEYCFGEWMEWPILFMIIILIPFLWKLVKKTNYSFSYPIVIVLFGFGLVAAMMTPPLFAVGNVEAQRLQAITYTMYMLVLVLCETYIIGWFQKKFKLIKNEGSRFSIDTIVFFLVCSLLFFVAAGLQVISEPHYFTVSSAMTDLLNGSARAYGESQKVRIQLYHSGELDIVVEPLKTMPVLLYFSDISEDSGDWQNRGLCKYYGLNSVRKEKK